MVWVLLHHQLLSFLLCPPERGTRGRRRRRRKSVTRNNGNEKLAWSIKLIRWERCVGLSWHCSCIIPKRMSTTYSWLRIKCGGMWTILWVIHLYLYSLLNSYQQLARPDTEIKLPRDIEKSLSEKERKKIKRVRGEAPSRILTPVGPVASKDQVPPERVTTRAMPFLPDPPSFDLTTNRNQRHRLLYD